VERRTLVVSVPHQDVANVMPRLMRQRQQRPLRIGYVQEDLARLGAIQPAVVQIECVQVDRDTDFAEPCDENLDVVRGIQSFSSRTWPTVQHVLQKRKAARSRKPAASTKTHMSSDVAARHAQAKIKSFTCDSFEVTTLADWVRRTFDPQTGASVRGPRAVRWFHVPKGFPGRKMLTPHLRGKQSVAVTWGPHANIRILDADAHDGAAPLSVLSVLWEGIQALHYGRGKVLPDLVGRALPTHHPDGSPVVLDGVIVTTPRGLHYIELLEPSSEDTPVVDKARVIETLRHYGVAVRYGRLEVFPNGNKQSRLPLGYGCEFVWPALGKVDAAKGIEILSSLRPVSRAFPERDGASETNVCEATQDADKLETTDNENVCEYDSAEPTFAPETRFMLARRRFCEARSAKSSGNRWGATLDEEGAFPRKGTGQSAFVEKMQTVLRDGATAGQRNREFWELCILLRLAWGWSREDVETRVADWIEHASHTSADLSHLDVPKRRIALRHLRRLLDKLDVGLASGKFFQLGARKSGRTSRDPLLLMPETPDELAELVELGTAELQRVTGTSMLDGLPTWLQRTLPALVGGIRKWGRDGRIAMPRRTLEAYAHTKKSKRSPFDGVLRPASTVMRECLERFGIIGGVATAAVKGRRLAAVYESNVGAPKIVVAAWPRHRSVKRKDAPWRRSPFVTVRRWRRTWIRLPDVNSAPSDAKERVLWKDWRERGTASLLRGLLPRCKRDGQSLHERRAPGDDSAGDVARSVCRIAPSLLRHHCASRARIEASTMGFVDVFTRHTMTASHCGVRGIVWHQEHHERHIVMRAIRGDDAAFNADPHVCGRFGDHCVAGSIARTNPRLLEPAGLLRNSRRRGNASNLHLVAVESTLL
jgi:hypothetical protein